MLLFFLVQCADDNFCKNELQSAASGLQVPKRPSGCNFSLYFQIVLNLRIYIFCNFLDIFFIGMDTNHLGGTRPGKKNYSKSYEMHEDPKSLDDLKENEKFHHVRVLADRQFALLIVFYENKCFQYVNFINMNVISLLFTLPLSLTLLSPFLCSTAFSLLFELKSAHK